MPLIPCEACCGILPELRELEGLAMPQSHETIDPPCPNPIDFDMQAHFVNGKMWVVLTNRVNAVVVAFFMEMAILAMLGGQVIHTPNQLLVLKSGQLYGGRGALKSF